MRHGSTTRLTPRSGAPMHRLLGALVVTSLLLGGGRAAAGDPADLGEAIDHAIRAVYPALVRIHVITVQPREGREVKREGGGSGVIISPDGYVITNHHVVAHAKRIQCILADKEQVEATLVGSDALADIAVVRIDLGRRRDKAPLAVAAFGDSDSLKVGDRVLAMGSPLALSQSVTLGVVSNVEMTIPGLLWPATFKLDGEETGSLVKWIGHDAQIYPGNSGGPLVNLAGEIVGINEISLGLSGAIPGNLAREVADQLVRQGEVRRSFLGLELQPLLRANGSERGVLVSGVVTDSPAEKAGIRAGDLLLAYAGQEVNVSYPEQLPALNRLILGTPVGQEVELTCERAGRSFRARAVTIPRGRAQADDQEIQSWGATLRDLTLLQARELRREPGSGVFVSSLRPGGPAAEAKPPLELSDVIVEVAGQKVQSLEELKAASSRVVGNQDKPMPTLVAFERQQERFLTVVRLGKESARDSSREATKAWLGIDTQVLTRELAEALGLTGQTGVRVTLVHPQSTAEAAGLEVGDVILKVDGEAIAARRAEDVEIFPAMVRQRRIGARAALDVVRDGQPRRVEAELAPSPPSTRELPEYRDALLEFQARDLTSLDRIEKQLDPGLEGVLVSAVESGGWASVAHLAVGDVILSADGRAIRKVEDLASCLRTVAEKRPERVVIFVRRGVHTLFLEIEPTWPSESGGRGER